MPRAEAKFWQPGGGVSRFMKATRKSAAAALDRVLSSSEPVNNALLPPGEADEGVAVCGKSLDAMPLLLDPESDPETMIRSADPATMVPPADAVIMTPTAGWTALMAAASTGQVDDMCLLLEHPSANPTAMIALRSVTGECTLMAAARFAAVQSSSDSWRPLQLLLRRVAMEPQPCDDQHARMAEVLETLCKGPHSRSLFDQVQPDDVRDECVRVLLERGACAEPAAGALCDNPVVSRLICGEVKLEREPQHINETIVHVASARQGEQRCAVRTQPLRPAPESFFWSFLVPRQPRN